MIPIDFQQYQAAWRDLMISVYRRCTPKELYREALGLMREARREPRSLKTAQRVIDMLDCLNEVNPSILAMACETMRRAAREPGAER